MVEAGTRMPADGVVIESDNLQCDESFITGEATHIKKSPLELCVV